MVLTWSSSGIGAGPLARVTSRLSGVQVLAPALQVAAAAAEAFMIWSGVISVRSSVKTTIGMQGVVHCIGTPLIAINRTYACAGAVCANTPSATNRAARVGRIERSYYVLPEHVLAHRARWSYPFGREDAHMEKRRLGRDGLEVSAIGLGCMGMSEFYGPASEEEAVATIHRAIDLGITLIDTADIYGPFTNEQLVGRALRGRRDRVVLATKFGYVRSGDGKFLGINGRPEYVRQACDASLKRLGVEAIDLYYQHRVDRQVPHLSRTDQIRHRADGVLDRHLPVDAVLVVEVDRLDA